MTSASSMPVNTSDDGGDGEPAPRPADTVATRVHTHRATNPTRPGSSVPRGRKPYPHLPTPFLSIPRELRDEIFARFIYLIYATAIPSPQHPFQHPLVHYNRRVAVNAAELNEPSNSLHLSCRQLRAEYLDAQATHTQHLHLYRDFEERPMIVPVPVATAPFAARLQNLEMRFERSVGLCVGDNTTVWQDLLSHYYRMLGRICNTCQELPALRRLTVTLHLRSPQPTQHRLIRGKPVVCCLEPDVPFMEQMEGPMKEFTDMILTIVPPRILAPNLREVRNRIVTPHRTELAFHEQIFKRNLGSEGFENVLKRTRPAKNMCIGYRDWAYEWAIHRGSFPTTVAWDEHREDLERALQRAERTRNDEQLRL